MVSKNKCHHFIFQKVDIEQKKRKVCIKCGFVDYENPKIVTGSLIIKNKKILLCKRAISPGYGKWPFPSGYLDSNETLEEGAIRGLKKKLMLILK